MFGRKISAGLMTGGAAIAMMMAFSAPAMAQGSEVEMLRSQVQDLLSRIEKLEKTPVPTVAAPPPAIAPGNPKVKVTFGGWINRAVTFADNGDDSDLLFVDNNGASSRINLSASGKVNDNLTLGSVLELEAISNSSRSTDIDTASTALSFNERKMEVWAEFANVGRVWLGQGDMATQAVAEIDLSGTANMGLYSDVGATFGGIGFNRTSGTGPTTLTVNSTMPNYDGLGNGRYDRIRFDTVSMGGFTAIAAVNHEGYSDFALRYAGKVGDTQVAAGVGYADATTTGNAAAVSDVLLASASVRLAGGLNFTFATAVNDFRAAGRESGSYWYGKVGYIAKVSSLGDTAIAIDYYMGEDTISNGSDATAIGATLVQQLTAINSELYFSIRTHEIDINGSDYDNVLGVMTGARVRF